MANYIGQAPINGFHAKQSLTGDGSTTTFTLDQTVASETSILVSVGGVLQEPAVAYNLAIGGTKITFTEAPSSTDTVYIHFLGKAVVQNFLDINGAEFVLDADADTSLTADTDDEIDIKIGGTDRSTIKATGFHNLDSIKFVAGTGDDMQMYHDGTNSFLTNSTGALKIATETSGIAVTIGHSTSEVTIADNATVTGNLTVSGTLTQTGAQTFDGGLTVDNFNLNGTTLALSSGDMLIDVAGDITLDADGADINFADAGTTFGTITNSSSDFVIFSAVSDKDILIKGNDGGSTITALTLDMSDAGAATFNSTVQATGLNIGGTAITSTAAEINIIDGGTSATSTTVADADRVVMNDNGTMVQVAVTDLAAYFDDEITAMPNLTSVGTLTALTVDDVAVNGKVITMTGSSSDTAVFTAGTDGTLSIVTTDAGGAAANIQITADGTAELAGTTVTLDSSGGITLDADGGTITFADAGSSLGTITSSGYSGTAAVATTVTVTDNESTDENNVLTFVAGADADGGNVGLESDGNLNYNPSSGTLNVPNISVTGTQTIVNSVTMNASNAVVFEGATADAHETTLSTIDATGDRTINLPNVSGTLPVLAAASATQITSTPEELNILDGATVVVGEINALDLGATAIGNAIASKAVILDANKDYTGGRNLTITGELDAATGDFSSDVDIDGDLLCGDDVTLDSDAAVLGFGADKDVTLTHVADTGLLLNGNMVLQFNDASQNIGATSGTVLDINATDEIELNATAIDINGTCDVSGAFTTGSTIVSTGKITADAGIDIDNFNIDGTTIALTSGDMVLDSAGDIILDADGGDIVLKDNGTQISRYRSVSENLYINVDVSDKDFVLQGNDGGTGITALTVDMSAAGAATFNNDVTAFSDARLKENVETIDNALDKVCAMRGVTFNRIDNKDGGRQMGVIAQEVQDIVPEVVKVNDDEDNTLSVSYGNLVGVLIESIKELKAEIDELKGN